MNNDDERDYAEEAYNARLLHDDEGYAPRPTTEDGYQRYVDTMEHIVSMEDNYDRQYVLETLIMLHTPGLFSERERDTMTCHILTTVDYGSMDSDAEKDVAKTVAFLSEQ